MLILKNINNMDGIAAAGWAENKLEIMRAGRVLITFSCCPENEYHSFLKTTNPKEFLETLKSKYYHEEKTVLG